MVARGMAAPTWVILTPFAGGVAASYVFLPMLPELIEGNEAIGKLLKKAST